MPWKTIPRGKYVLLRATASIDANFPSILHKKAIFFYFIHPFLQNIHIRLFILHIYLIKYSFFCNFLLLSLTAPLFHKPTLSHRPKPNTLSQT